MYSASRACLILVALLCSAAVASAQALRICADPNNLPYSNTRGEGFENQIATLFARDLSRSIQYVWLPPSPRQSEKLQKSGACDLMMEVPARYSLLHPTQPYFRSSYVFVTRKKDDLTIRSLDDARLRSVRIGLPGVGDGSFTPAAQELANRGIRNVSIYTVFGNLADENPPARLIEAVAADKIDVAVAWGPLAGYFAKRSAFPLAVRPICPGQASSLPLAFSMSVGVRWGDDALYREVETEILRRRDEIQHVLRRYGVPLLNPASQSRLCP
jgi:mxaJ protein